LPFIPSFLFLGYPNRRLLRKSGFARSRCVRADRVCVRFQRGKRMNGPLGNPESEKIEHIRKMRHLGHTYFKERSEVYRKFVEMEAVTFKDGALSKREKELVAIGISIVTDCESCLEWHIHEALRSGGTEQQVVEAIGVGLEMGVGRTTVTARFAAAVLAEGVGDPVKPVGSG